MSISPTLLEPPSQAQLLAVLSARGELPMPSFTAIELAAVGAGSPLRGLVASPRFLAMTDEELAGGMAGALDKLAAEGALERPEPNTASGKTAMLGGPLSTIVGVRRSPAVLVTVTLAARRALNASDPVDPSAQLLAALHGMAVQGMGLVGLLEETRTPEDDHNFVLCTPSRAAERLWITAARLQEAERAQADNGLPEEIGLAMDVFHPDPVEPSHLKLVLSPVKEGEGPGLMIARTAKAPGNWESTDSVDLTEWQRMFCDLTAIPQTAQ